MKRLSLLLLIPALFACDLKAKQQLAELQTADSLRTDSLMSIKNQLLNDMLVSTQFINDIESEISKAKALAAKKASNAKLATPSEAAKIKEDREEVLGKIRHLVARLDSVEGRLHSLRKQASQFAQRDSMLTQQIAQYEKNIADARETLERQRREFQATIDQQNVQIASLKSTVDTVTQQNTQLTTVKVALIDTVSQLTREKNTAYYVIGTRDELVEKGVLVEEGHKRFLLIGNRPVQPARAIDPGAFTKIDRLKDLDITLPEGEYTIFSRQDPAFIQPTQSKDGRLVGGLHVTSPEQFWAASKFLILIKN